MGSSDALDRGQNETMVGDLQVLIFDSKRVLYALARTAYDASLLTSVAEEDIERCCEEKSDKHGDYNFRYDCLSLITCEDAFDGLTLDEYDKFSDIILSPLPNLPTQF